jgi:hypothetical protein
MDPIEILWGKKYTHAHLFKSNVKLIINSVAFILKYQVVIGVCILYLELSQILEENISLEKTKYFVYSLILVIPGMTVLAMPIWGEDDWMMRGVGLGMPFIFVFCVNLICSYFFMRVLKEYFLGKIIVKVIFFWFIGNS